MLNALAPDTLSLHTAFPGLTGASEVTGGAPAYVRKAVTFGAAAGASRVTSAAATFDVPAGTTVRWVGLWAGGTYLGTGPNGGTPREFVAIASTDTIYSPAHGYSDTQKIVFYNGTVPGGFTEGVVVFVRDSTTDTFKVAASAGGAAIDITTSGSTDCILSSITEDVYAAQNTHSISAASVGLPF
jgi:hypothetical protein